MQGLAADFNQMISTTVRLIDEYGITFEDRSRIFMDSANPCFIRALKERQDEETNYEQQIPIRIFRMRLN